jgi:hypothetical protein
MSSCEDTDKDRPDRFLLRISRNVQCSRVGQSEGDVLGPVVAFVAFLTLMCSAIALKASWSALIVVGCAILYLLIAELFVLLETEQTSWFHIVLGAASYPLGVGGILLQFSIIS